MLVQTLLVIQQSKSSRQVDADAQVAFKLTCLRDKFFLVTAVLRDALCIYSRALFVMGPLGLELTIEKTQENAF